MNDEPKIGNLSLFGCSDKELIDIGNKMINRHGSDIVAPEMMRRLKVSIEILNKNSSKWSNRIFWLTVFMGVVAILQLSLIIFGSV